MISICCLIYHSASESGSVSSSGWKEKGVFLSGLFAGMDKPLHFDKHVYLKKKTDSVSPRLWLNLEHWTIFNILFKIIIEKHLTFNALGNVADKCNIRLNINLTCGSAHRWFMSWYYYSSLFYKPVSIADWRASLERIHALARIWKEANVIQSL